MQKGGYNKRGSLISDEVRLHGAGGCGPHCLRGRAGSKAFLQPFKAAGEEGGLAWYHEDRERCRREGAESTVPGREGGIIHLREERGADRNHLSGREESGISL